MNLAKVPIFQGFHIEGVQHITPSNAYSALCIGEAILIDVREEYEFIVESIPLSDIFNFPMSGIVAHLLDIPIEKPIIVMCKAGVRSVKVVHFLHENGMVNAFNLDGGITAWEAFELPLKFNS